MNENKHFSLSVKKRNVAMLAESVTEKAAGALERLRQKRDKVIASTPVINKIAAKIKKFDKDMTEKHGHVYTKLRDSAKNTIRTVAAYQLFGVPGVVALCAYKTGEKAFSLIRPACKAKAAGEVSSLMEYFKRNRNECRFTMTSAALSIASAAATATGVKAASNVIRIGKASLLATPELKNTLRSTKKWIEGEQDFAEVRRDAAVLGITVATYFAGPAGVPMTRGAGKPLEEKTPEQYEADERKRQERRERTAERFNRISEQIGEFHNKQDQFFNNMFMRMRKDGR